MLILTIIFYFCIIFIGPRNLNANLNVRDYEEEKQNVNDEMILQDDEDDNFIHLDYADDFD